VHKGAKQTSSDAGEKKGWAGEGQKKKPKEEWRLLHPPGRQATTAIPVWEQNSWTGRSKREERD